jgi:hypothetical protein
MATYRAHIEIVFLKIKIYRSKRSLILGASYDP